MGKKVREYKSGDFIFAKVKGYPAWPARVQKLNGKKYFVYFYGTGETANLPPNMIFDYAENKDKFLTKTQKRRDFNDGVKQIEHDFANNVPLEQVIGIPKEGNAEAPANEPDNTPGASESMDETADTTANETADDDTIANVTNEPAVEDSDENGALVIDEGKASKKKAKAESAKTPAKEIPKAKEPKTPRGKAKKDDIKKEKDEDKTEDTEDKKEEEIVSRSGRKIRPKRFVDEQTEDNSTLPSPAKRKRAASPQVEKDKPEPKDKNIKSFNAVKQSEIEDLKHPFKPEDPDKENILIAYLPSGKYVGIKLFQSRPTRFKNEATRLQWDRQAASNAITLNMQLERGQITALSVQGQLVMDLNLTDEEKATLDKERENDEKKSRVHFLKTEMKLIELDAKIKTCLSLEKADAELCLQMLDELIALDVKPLMLLKHPTCLETVKRMRAYVGNTPSWDLSENAALVFSKQAHRIRKLADTLYKTMKELFTTPDGLSFWEYFSERVLQFKKVAAKLSASELLEMVHEPIEMSQPTSHTMTAAIDAANDDTRDEEPKKKATPAKSKKPAESPPVASKGKRHSSRKQVDTEVKEEEVIEEAKKDVVDVKEAETPQPEASADVEMTGVPVEDAVCEKEIAVAPESAKTDKAKKNKAKEGKKSLRNIEKIAKDTEKDAEKDGKDAEKGATDAGKTAEAEDGAKNEEISSKDESGSKDDDDTVTKDQTSAKALKADTEEKKSPKKGPKETEKISEAEKKLDETNVDMQEAQTSAEKEVKEKGSNKKDDKKKTDKHAKESDKRKVDDDKTKEDEPRVKRSRETRESKKVDALPRSPAKRKSKY